MDRGSQQNTGTLVDFLRIAFIRFRLTAVQQRGILEAIQPQASNIFQDPRTLPQTSRTTPSVELSNGRYIHVGLESSAIRQLSKEDPPPDALVVQRSCDGCDGFPFIEYAAVALNLKVIEPSYTLVFTVVLYCGKGRPSSVSDLCNERIYELNTMPRNTAQVGTEPVWCAPFAVVRNKIARASIWPVK